MGFGIMVQVEEWGLGGIIVTAVIQCNLRDGLVLLSASFFPRNGCCSFSLRDMVVTFICNDASCMCYPCSIPRHALKLPCTVIVSK